MPRKLTPGERRGYEDRQRALVQPALREIEPGVFWIDDLAIRSAFEILTGDRFWETIPEASPNVRRTRALGAMRSAIHAVLRPHPKTDAWLEAVGKSYFRMVRKPRGKGGRLRDLIDALRSYQAGSGGVDELTAEVQMADESFAGLAPGKISAVVAPLREKHKPVGQTNAGVFLVAARLCLLAGAFGYSGRGESRAKAERRVSNAIRTTVNR